jgi:ABC-type branched-subunit amino acid transport system ATPase component
MTVLALENVSKSVGGLDINREVTIEVARGERRALVGPNGAGKTTLMNLAAGLTRPTSGRVLLDGHDVTRLPAHRRARRGIARTFQITNLLPSMTVRENVAVAVQAGERSRCNPVVPWTRLRTVWSRVDELVERGRLADVAGQPVSTLPYGVQRRLEIVVACARPAKVILLDEPGAGLTSEETEDLLDFVFTLGDDVGILFVDHDIDLVLRAATEITVLHLGAVLTHGTPQNIASSGILDEIYLGRAANA